MTLLLDTHAFLWFCQGDPALSATAKDLIENPGWGRPVRCDNPR